MTRNLESAERMGEPILVIDLIPETECGRTFFPDIKFRIGGRVYVNVPFHELPTVDGKKVITAMRDIEGRSRIYSNGRDVTSEYLN